MVMLTAEGNDIWSKRSPDPALPYGRAKGSQGQEYHRNVGSKEGGCPSAIIGRVGGAAVIEPSIEHDRLPRSNQDRDRDSCPTEIWSDHKPFSASLNCDAARLNSEVRSVFGVVYDWPQKNTKNAKRNRILCVLCVLSRLGKA